ncbi:MAG TPA: AraC family transcriptional regulator [Flavipsychrobacter sp.]|jgi:AraC-like DNA-binding protein|nr:AraC family transcriptional regulator [Flavipsychrobacter sp.]
MKDALAECCSIGGRGYKPLVRLPEDLKIWVGWSQSNCLLQVSSDLWYVRTEQKFVDASAIKLGKKNRSQLFYELNYFLVHSNSRTTSKDQHLRTMTVFSSTANELEWTVDSDTTVICHAFLFTERFLQENLNTGATSLQRLLCIVSGQNPSHYQRNIFTDEMILIQQLEGIIKGDSAEQMHPIGLKTLALRLFCCFIDNNKTVCSSDPDFFFAASINLMRNGLETAFPGIKQLAAVSNVSVPTFKRRFKSLYRTTPEQYFRQLQMDKAETLLGKTKVTVREVGFRLGYNSIQSFSSTYKKCKGHLPSEAKMTF